MTDKYQVTIPKDVRDEVGLRPGEEVTVESAPGGSIVVKRFEPVEDPLRILTGKKPLSQKPISQRRLEKIMEERD